MFLLFYISVFKSSSYSRDFSPLFVIYVTNISSQLYFHFVFFGNEGANFYGVISINLLKIAFAFLVMVRKLFPISG